MRECLLDICLLSGFGAFPEKIVLRAVAVVVYDRRMRLQAERIKKEWREKGKTKLGTVKDIESEQRMSAFKFTGPASPTMATHHQSRHLQ